MIYRRYVYCLIAIIVIVCAVLSYYLHNYISVTQSKLKYLEQKIGEYTTDTSNLEIVVTQEQQNLVNLNQQVAVLLKQIDSMHNIKLEVTSDDLVANLLHLINWQLQHHQYNQLLSSLKLAIRLDAFDNDDLSILNTTIDRLASYDNNKRTQLLADIAAVIVKLQQSNNVTTQVNNVTRVDFRSPQIELSIDAMYELMLYYMARVQNWFVSLFTITHVDDSIENNHELAYLLPSLYLLQQAILANNSAMYTSGLMQLQNVAQSYSDIASLLEHLKNYTLLTLDIDIHRLISKYTVVH